MWQYFFTVYIVSKIYPYVFLLPPSHDILYIKAKKSLEQAFPPLVIDCSERAKLHARETSDRSQLYEWDCWQFSRYRIHVQKKVCKLARVIIVWKALTSAPIFRHLNRHKENEETNIAMRPSTLECRGLNS